MVYSKMIDTYSNAIENKFSEISTRYNFDKGEEFEIAICELLQSILPDKYGICRGFVVTETDNFAGDDIIIYDKDRFPTLRLLEKQKFDKKQEIPVEAVYAYIEAKHTLHLLDNESGQSLYKAFEQVNNVKKLEREKRGLLSIDPYSTFGGNFHTDRINWPNYLNPLYGAIISRYVRNSSNKPEILSTEMLDTLAKAPLPKGTHIPDLVVLGSNDIMFPGIKNNTEMIYDSPFYIDGKSSLIHNTVKKSALALGMIKLLYALDTIRLDKMPYRKIINNNLPHN